MSIHLVVARGGVQRRVHDPGDQRRMDRERREPGLPLGFEEHENHRSTSGASGRSFDAGRRVCETMIVG